MKKIIYLLFIILIISCDLQNESGTKEPDELAKNEKQARFLKGGTWGGISYGTAGLFGLYMTFNKDDAKMVFMVTSTSGQKEITEYQIKVGDNFLYYYNLESESWEKYLRIVDCNTQGNYSSFTAYFYFDGEEASMSVKFLRDDLYDFNYQEFLGDNLWTSEKLSLYALNNGFSTLDSRIEDEYNKEFPPVDPVIENIINTDLEEIELENKTIQELLEDDSSCNSNIENDGLPKEYHVTLKFDFNINELDLSVYYNDVIKFQIVKSFKLEGKVIYIQDENNEWVEWNKIEYKDEESFNLGYKFTKI